ncbi:hypothetical protein [Desulfobacula toluolica]|uniref:Conserved uncharacterized protein, associated with flagellar apparatus genes n=1 Tax=Desulfobacula toluolica (strain DSM 7467 / Tol2) TaxID=651182 RepID=K0NRX9_DESTT|nr:hypothetical protein [Desulfobacula toluolica]CCK81722.1 conserved uncharacterized protein, associated with flagellar apparatus genes [Desulfobacula toluolica Tol2]
MSDPGLEEDGLISQDDIDKLLDSSSIEEAEEILSNNVADGDDEFGELSQDDIDALMNSSVSVSENSIDEDDVEDDEMELISQDDIDQLMNSSVSDSEDPIDEDDVEDDDIELISQDDINDLMDSNDASDEDVELISQDDINTLMGGGSTEDISRDDGVIDESEAVDARNCLIVQETIDDLMRNFDTDVPSEPVVLDEDPFLDSQPEPVDQTQFASDPGSQPEPDELNEEKASELDDIEDFLTPDSDVSAFDFDDEGVQEDENDFQDDIDAFLLEDEEGEEGEEGEEDYEDILISQDDIDTLLMVADQEDEDVLGDLMDNDFGSSLEDPVGEDEVGEDELSEPDNTDKEDEGQVVLEEEDHTEKSNKKARSKWYKSKFAVACASVLVVLGIAVPLTYFFFFSGETGESSHPKNVGEVAIETQREIEVETVDIHIEKQDNIKKSGNIILNDFVILASDLSKDMTYITVDISIDYSDQSAYFEIQNNLSFYRDLIYDSLNQSLVSEKREGITETDILWIVETALKKALPGPYIDRVSFKSFTAS